MAGAADGCPCCHSSPWHPPEAIDGVNFTVQVQNTWGHQWGADGTLAMTTQVNGNGNGNSILPTSDTLP
jgi:hypothetical protein